MYWLKELKGKSKEGGRREREGKERGERCNKGERKGEEKK